MKRISFDRGIRKEEEMAPFVNSIFKFQFPIVCVEKKVVFFGSLSLQLGKRRRNGSLSKIQL